MGDFVRPRRTFPKDGWRGLSPLQLRSRKIAGLRGLGFGGHFRKVEKLKNEDEAT
jgi:hypothetical protein